MNYLIKFFLIVATFILFTTEKSFAANSFPQASYVKKNDVIVSKNVPVETQTFYMPIPVKGADGKFYLLYEIHLTYLPVLNQNKITLKQVDVVNKNNNQVLATYTNKTLTQITRQLGKATDAKDKDVMQPGARIVIYPFVIIADQKNIPHQLIHRFTFIEQTSNKPIQIETDAISVQKKYTDIIDSPLRGGGWLVFDGLGIENHHRNDIITTEGTTRVPQRFAVDWLKLDKTGSPYKSGSDPNKNSSYYGYGEKVYAVADGTVTSVNDNLPDNTPVGTILAKAQTIEQAAGNTVGVNIGNNRYAFYCHLQPHSMTVKLGDKVKRGQVIGLLGNSGFSHAPHLHFHIVDKNSVLGGEGIPYVLSTFEVQMTPEQVIKAIEDVKRKKAILIPKQGTVQHDEMPLMDSVILFPEK